jgi:hypothetical protein
MPKANDELHEGGVEAVEASAAALRWFAEPNERRA